MMHLFDGETADVVWQKAIEAFRKGNAIHDKGSRNGGTKEMLHVGFSIENPRQRWITSRWPPANIAFAIAEIVWILNGRRDSKFLNYWNRQLPKYAGNGDNFCGAYGFRLRKHLGFDQLERAYQTLDKNPDCRQVVLQIWDACTDLPDVDGKPRNEDIPCNLISMLKVNNGALEWMQIVRSNDLFLGTPYNFVQFTTLQEVLAGWLHLEIGSFIHVTDSLHVYSGDIPKLDKSHRITTEPNTDTLAVSKQRSDDYFHELDMRIEAFVHEGLSKEEHAKLATWKEAPQPFQNLLFVLAAEAARRREWCEIALDIMTSCTNPCFTQLWQRWFSRVSPQFSQCGEKPLA